MADLSSIERRKLERLFRMGSGYVLDFSDRTFSEFFEEHTRRDIDATVYRERGTSKANRLRGFWEVEGNHLVGKVIQVLILYGQTENCLGDEPGLTELTDDCWKIASRMMRDAPVAELDALTARPVAPNRQRLAPAIDPVVIAERDGTRRRDRDVHAVPVRYLVRRVLGFEVLQCGVGKHRLFLLITAFLPSTA
jgi:hypothetical protein